MNSSPNRMLPVVYSALIMTFMAMFPVINLINVFCCAGISLGGFAGAYFYARQLENTNIPLTAKDCGMIGLLGGILSAVIVSGFSVLAALVSKVNPMSDMTQVFEEMGFPIPPEMLTYIDKFSEEYASFGFSPTVALISFASNIIFFPLFGALGAIIGSNVFGRKATRL